MKKKTEFFFNTVPEFLQALNLSVSSPLVSKLLIAYGVKISATYEANGDHATCANAGNLIHYILIFLLNTTRPSNETFSCVCTQTGMQLTHYNDVYGEYFISYITRGLIINLSQNYFDEQFLLLCGDIETNPGPRKKVDHKNKIARLKGIPSQQMKKIEATRMNNEGKSCMSDIENCGKQYEIMSATAGNSSPRSATYMYERIGSTLVQIMACCLFGTKPLSQSMLGYQLSLLEQISVTFYQNMILFIN